MAMHIKGARIGPMTLVLAFLSSMGEPPRWELDRVVAEPSHRRMEQVVSCSVTIPVKSLISCELSWLAGPRVTGYRTLTFGYLQIPASCKVPFHFRIGRFSPLPEKLTTRFSSRRLRDGT